MTKPNRQKCDLLLERFHQYMKVANFSPRTIESYLQNIRYFFDYLEAQETIGTLIDVTRQALNEYQTYVYYFETKGGKHLSASTQRIRLTVLKTFFSYLLKEDIIVHNPAADIILPKKRKKLPHSVLTKKEAFKILEMPDLTDTLGFRDRTILETLYSTGIRVSELINLTIFDVEIERNVLRVNSGKGAKDRIVPCGEIALDFIQTYLETIRPKLIQTNEQKSLFITNRGKKFKRANMNSIIANYAKKAGVSKHVTPHTWRHTCATHLLKGRADIRHIQEILGHRSISTTQIYTKVELTDLKKIHQKCHPRG